ncbi:MAG: leucyl/phenylalanyl-tRNA--protein transferase [Balneolaceae bacterium]
MAEKSGLNFVYTYLSKSYLLVLERLVLKLFVRPDIAVRCTYNTVKPSPEQVISNFFQGIVLFGNANGGLFWGSRSRRAIITQESARIQKRLEQYMKRERVDLRYNENVEEVIRSCRRKDEGTWINEPLIDIYMKLNSMGWMNSMEAYRDGKLVAGLWGLKIGHTFSVMSMFHRANRAGSILFGHLVRKVMKGELKMIDCVDLNSNFRRYGAHAVPLADFNKKIIRHFNQTDPASGARPSLISITDKPSTLNLHQYRPESLRISEAIGTLKSSDIYSPDVNGSVSQV